MPRSKLIVIQRDGSIGDVAAAVPGINYLLHSANRDTTFAFIMGANQARLIGIESLKFFFPQIHTIIIFKSKFEYFAKLFYLFLFAKLNRLDEKYWFDFHQVDSRWSRHFFLNALLTALGFSSPRFGYYKFLSLNYSSREGIFRRESERILLMSRFFVRRSGLVGAAVIPPAEIICKEIESDNLMVSKKVLVLAPQASREVNRWPMSNFIQIASFWLEAVGGEVVFWGGGNLETEVKESDSFQNDEIVNNSVSRIHFWSGQAICRFPSLLNSASLVISNDSGPSHLAALSTVPQIVIFSCRDKRGLWWPHKKSNLKIFQSDFICGPCYVKDRCFADSACIKAISTDMVLGYIRTKFL